MGRMAQIHRELHGFWARTRPTILVAYAVAGGVLLAGVAFFGGEIGRHIDGVEAWIAGLGPWAPLVFILLYAVLSSVFVPDLLLGIVAGSAFGFTQGLVAVAVGSLGGATLQYVLARRLLKRIIDGFLISRPVLAVILGAVRQQEMKLQLLIRLTPLNRAVTSYALGAIGVGFGRFAVACVALIPSLSLEVYVGYAGKQLARMAGRPEHTVVLHDVMVIAGLAVAVAVMAVVSRTARDAVAAAAATTPAPP